MINNRIIQLIVGGAVGSTIALNILPLAMDLPAAKAAIQLAQALSPEEINLRAKQIIVRIDGASIGSGSIVEYSDNAYTVLTNWHVMKNQGSYLVQTIDGRQHQVDPATIKQLPGLDLAVFKFTSNQNYQTAELGDSSNLSEGQNVYFAGYPGELRREDNRYYRFFTANLVGILPKSTDNGYSLVYSGEAFPGMSGGPVFSQNGLMIGVHGEANIHAISGATSNYGIPISSYQQAIANLDTQPPAKIPQAEEGIATTTTTTTPEVANQPEVEQPVAPTNPTPTEVNDAEVKDSEQTSEQPETSGSLSNNISSVPTFSGSSTPKTPAVEPEVVIDSKPANSKPEQAESETEPEVIVDSATEEQPEVAEQPDTSEIKKSQQNIAAQSKPVESEEINVSRTPKQISLISQKTGIDYTKLRNLLREKKWSEADIHTYQLIEQIVKTAKQQNKHVFIELKTIAEFSCSDVRTVDYLWQKYSDDKFGFSPQQEIWQNVNQEGDFSTQTWRRFATEVGWKKGEVKSGNGYLLYEQLDFAPTEAPSGHLPWWFALPDEEQKVIKYLFARCNLNPTDQELEAETKKNSQDTAQNSSNNQPDINKPPKSLNNKPKSVEKGV